MKPGTRIQDEWLALRCRTNEPGAYSDLVAAMESPLLYYAMKLTGSQDAALDVLQEVWIRAFRDIRKLKDPSAIRPWLYRMVHGISIDYLRRIRHEVASKNDEIEPSDIAVDEHFDANDAAVVHQALDELQPAQREVLVLFFLEEFSISEIAQATGCAEGTIKSRLHYAKKALRKIISRSVYGQRK